MTIEELTTERNKELYEEVAKHYRVHLVEDKSGGTGWGSNVIGANATVFWTPTGHPEESFTHELLHFYAQQKGYKRVRTALSIDPTISAALPRIISALDNEIQHHKMYPAFASMGYEPSLFYNDDDAGVDKYLVDVLAEPNQRIHEIGIDYITAIAPGGTMTDSRREEFRTLFRQYNGGNFATTFDKIDGILADWVKTESYDAEGFINRIIRVFTREKVWMNYTDSMADFPLSGYFVNGPFMMK